VGVLEVLAPFVGAAALEVVHWFRLREKLQLAKYQKLLRSTGYWVVTALMILVGGFVTLIYLGDNDRPDQLLIVGAAFPTLFKSLIGAATDRQQTTLGPTRDSAGNNLRAYFSAT
jgi:FtsH-binding integral membrane protein